MRYIASLTLRQSYKDKAALGVHGSSETFKAFQKKMQDEDLQAASQVRLFPPASHFPLTTISLTTITF